jgi:cytochrome P450
MGVYFPSRYDDIRAIAYDTKHFSSRRVVVRETPPPKTSAPPITSDPPEHRPAKQVWLPAFTPDAIKPHEPRAREICRELLGRLAGKSGGGAAVDYAQEMPVRVIAHMLGIAEQDGDRFRKWIHLGELGITDNAALVRARTEMQAFLTRR